MIDHDAIADRIRQRLIEDAFDARLEHRRRHRSARSSGQRKSYAARVHAQLVSDPMMRGRG